ncbi:GCN5-related N-acetyltransferase [Sphingobium chlorophenolicum L-1]|uniref:GCN5-related N-acetyltransferase n=1 Tax=Sphingobium chlorophenolicum L-1 TaxID=690566 RepID=F6EUJ9_SPHCR|nr:GNAT family N-acetyltransferase [Sphingobium chlorophenolicum]AEG47893.1 GCN5-related N-acetyltransferase [Sphingobium chlorophenolicum L-1]
MDIRPAALSDLPQLHPIIERAYRGDTARESWAIESAPPSGPRTSIAALEAILANPAERLLVALRTDGTPSGCVQISDKGAGVAYLGLLCVDPGLQSSGLGHQLIAAAEQLAATTFAARRMEMTVIATHDKLIQYYQRRGYRPTGERRPYPVPLDPPRQMLVLAKSLAA